MIACCKQWCKCVLTSNMRNLPLSQLHLWFDKRFAAGDDSPWHSQGAFVAFCTSVSLRGADSWSIFRSDRRFSSRIFLQFIETLPRDVFMGYWPLLWSLTLCAGQWHSGSSVLELVPLPQHRLAKLRVKEQTQVNLKMKHKCSKPGLQVFQTLLRCPWNPWGLLGLLKKQMLLVTFLWETRYSGRNGSKYKLLWFLFFLVSHAHFLGSKVMLGDGSSEK